MLTLQAVLLISVMLVTATSSLSVARRMRRNVILRALQLRLIHLIQDLNAKLDITKQLIASALREILSHHDSQHLEIVRMRRHGISRHNPASASKLMSESEFIVVLFTSLEAECNERQAFAVLLGHDDEAELFEGCGEVVGGAG